VLAGPPWSDACLLDGRASGIFSDITARASSTPCVTTLPIPSVVLFVENVPRMAEFYRQLGAMRQVHGDERHVVLEIVGVQLVLHALPPGADSPANHERPLQLREDSYLKFCFPVSSIARAREQAAALGGAILPPEQEWEARGFRACDGHDPEGNVLQVRVPATTPLPERHAPTDPLGD